MHSRRRWLDFLTIQREALKAIRSYRIFVRSDGGSDSVYRIAASSKKMAILAFMNAESCPREAIRAVYPTYYSVVVESGLISYWVGWRGEKESCGHMHSTIALARRCMERLQSKDPERWGLAVIHDDLSNRVE